MESVGSHESEDFSESSGTEGFMNLNLQDRGSHESESPEKQGFGTEGFIRPPVGCGAGQGGTAYKTEPRARE